MIKTLARFFSGVHQAFGITNLPANATPAEERNFVLMWIGIILFSLFWVIVILGLILFLGLRR